MVSVIIPNYNGKHFLKVCIDSLKEQSYKNIEIIVGSDDGDGAKSSHLSEIITLHPEVK